ncbi:LOW QUALITY PROTEIN: IQ motif-containing protein H [Megalobrama amblycephala]|uniref:LOW QUALITY PROTEIN: IQ motif-containing protein H n=1 Tax=Megalobrama amblycephala TaxID=75352 RepID=UPI0020140AB6|nr:LOW QUALITY PROTEIN: IQ motif-containing protein H [Megalobrama amblycephala]
MADVLKNKDEVGHILVKVQDDLRQLKKNLVRLTVQQNGEVLDIQALDTAISRTENGIRRHADDYLKTINNQVLTLPCIEEPEKKNAPAKPVKWQPPYETIPNARPQRSHISGPSPGEKHKSAFITRLLNNPFHPKNKELMQQNYGIQFPNLHKRNEASVGTQRVVTGPALGNFATTHGALPKQLHPKSPPECEHTNAVLQPSAADLSSVQTPPQPKAVHVLQREDSGQSKMDESEKACKREMDVCRDGMALGRSSTESPASRTMRTPPPSAASASSDNRVLTRGFARLTPLNLQSIPVPAAVSKYPFTIVEGQIDTDAPDYCRFKKQYCLCWGAIVEALDQLQRMLLDFAVPLARVCGERLAACVQSSELDWRGSRGWCAHVENLLSVLENRDEVWDLMCQPGQRYKGNGGHQTAAVCIQTCWRRYSARTAYLLQLRPKWAAQIIAMSLLKRAKLGHLKKSLQASRLRQLENYRIRAESLAAKWKHITSAKRTIIHVPSLGYSQHQRLSLRGFDVLQNTQMGRLCEIRDENIEVIYVSPVCLGEDVLQYYTHLLGLQTAIELGDASAPESNCAKRFTILMPEAMEYFSTRNMCLASLLKYSPRTLKRIKNLIQGKQAYMVGGVIHIDDLAVADELEVPLLGTEPAVAQLYGTKSGGRRIFTGAGVDMPPGKEDIYTLEQLYEGLAQLMTEHMEVQRWLFKVDSEVGGRGTAYCDVCYLKCHPWAQQEFSRHGPEQWRVSLPQEPVMTKFLEEVPHLLASYAQPANTSCYSTWTCFLEHFLREGGVIEAFPPSDSVTCLTVDLLVEPGGDVHMLSMGDQLRGPSGLEVVGCTVPQSSICPDVLHSVCNRIGQACQQRSIMGHLSLDLVTFLDPSNLEQQVWAIDLDLGYSNQLAMTQMMLMMTRGTLDCRTSKLEVSPPVRDVKSSVRHVGVKTKAQTSVTSRFAVMCTRLLHTNLSLVYYSTFFLMCKAQGIGYDVKARQGTVFALHDSRDRRSLGMLTISENLQGALLTFARNLSVIHQEISAPNMQGTNNFKGLIKDIEEVLGMTIQNQTTSQEEKEISAVRNEQISPHKPHRPTPK